MLGRNCTKLSSSWGNLSQLYYTRKVSFEDINLIFCTALSLNVNVHNPQVILLINIQSDKVYYKVTTSTT